jgi:hypothetical protein
MYTCVHTHKRGGNKKWERGRDATKDGRKEGGKEGGKERGKEGGGKEEQEG